MSPSWKAEGLTAMARAVTIIAVTIMERTSILIPTDMGMVMVQKGLG